MTLGSRKTAGRSAVLLDEGDGATEEREQHARDKQPGVRAESSIQPEARECEDADREAKLDPSARRLADFALFSNPLSTGRVRDRALRLRRIACVIRTKGARGIVAGRHSVLGVIGALERPARERERTVRSMEEAEERG